MFVFNYDTFYKEWRKFVKDNPRLVDDKYTK